jgi:hypothetical protein
MAHGKIRKLRFPLFLDTSLGTRFPTLRAMYYRSGQALKISGGGGSQISR